MIYRNQDVSVKKFNDKKYYLPKGIIKNYNVIVNGKNLYNQPIDSDLKQYEEFKKLTTGQGKGYTILLKYDMSKIIIN